MGHITESTHRLHSDLFLFACPSLLHPRRGSRLRLRAARLGQANRPCVLGATLCVLSVINFIKGEIHPKREMEDSTVFSPRLAFKGAFLLVAVSTLTACKNGGDLSLEPGVRRPATNQSSPFVQVNQGGKALIIENGKTATTGVHGWVTVQPVTAKNLSGSNGSKIVLRPMPTE